MTRGTLFSFESKRVEVLRIPTVNHRDNWNNARAVLGYSRRNCELLEVQVDAPTAFAPRRPQLVAVAMAYVTRLSYQLDQQWLWNRQISGRRLTIRSKLVAYSIGISATELDAAEEFDDLRE